ncbi:polymer-forming cytoskeletal protein [Dokdonella sp.]|uniref:bactofilin family protein n=1 Tax=Dokdonella sp. TaxID=2291710 RepID=UPI001B198F8A|nr:polymer-forming cytoskeletal protein [Dokdonella sp.]MBO9664371.1 polymer-forming cytoskeletal protein [Dokdonella sp.]
MFGSSNKGNGKHAIAAISTLIAEGTTIRGDVHFGGGLHLEGVIDGAVSAEGGDSVLTLSEKGRINGEVRVANAVINGTVKGDIFVGERLEIAGNARIEGNVHYKLLEMAAGAQINGQMLYQSEPPRRLPAPELTGAVAEA